MSGPLKSYGKSEHVVLNGIDYYCASQAEKWWLEEVTPGLVSGDVVSLVWQPPPSLITYKHARQTLTCNYRPDAIITWKDGDEWVIEIKRGILHQTSASHMKYFAQQYPDKKLVLVWFGWWPTKGVARRRLDALRPWLHHTWRMKAPKRKSR